jgi:protocatechuate 3,4-dioxygenase, beta subunit
MTMLVEKRDPLTQSQGVEPGYDVTALRWPSQPLQKRPLTASELTGPADVLRRLPALRDKFGGDLAGHGAKRAIGQLIHVRARVVDEDGAPLPGAVVEIWHANAAGKYIHPNDTHDAPVDPNFYGAARLVAGDSGLVELRTVKPGAYPVPDLIKRGARWWRPPHIHFSVWGRVWLSRLVTQMFFPGEPLNDSDPVLNAIREPQARSRCIARFSAEGPDNALVYEYQIVVRGRQATPGLQ